MQLHTLVWGALFQRPVAYKETYLHFLLRCTLVSQYIFAMCKNAFLLWSVICAYTFPVGPEIIPDSALVYNSVRT